jgi:hypothetical protein
MTETLTARGLGPFTGGPLFAALPCLCRIRIDLVSEIESNQLEVIALARLTSGGTITQS